MHSIVRIKEDIKKGNHFAFKRGRSLKRKEAERGREEKPFCSFVRRNEEKEKGVGGWDREGKREKEGEKVFVLAKYTVRGVEVEERIRTLK